nr:MAG TPA: hypothetical protein [Caudoviricetes sp.]
MAGVGRIAGLWPIRTQAMGVLSVVSHGIEQAH